MFKKAVGRIPSNVPVTVNSSLYAVPVYQRLGFEADSPPQRRNGLDFVPMTAKRS